MQHFIAMALLLSAGLAQANPVLLEPIVLLTVFTVTSGQLLPTVGDEGSMSGGLPGFTQLLVPLNLQTLAIIWPCALSIAFVGLMESLLTARLVDDLTVTPSNKNRESAGLGIANILAGFYGGIAGCAMGAFVGAFNALGFRLEAPPYALRRAA